MDSSGENTEIIVKVVREVIDEHERASVIFQGLQDESGRGIRINLADSDVADIKVLFDSIFAKIYDSKTNLIFRLDDSKTDLYNQVSRDIIEHLEKEIEQSRENFEKIWELTEKEEAIEE